MTGSAATEVKYSAVKMLMGEAGPLNTHTASWQVVENKANTFPHSSLKNNKKSWQRVGTLGGNTPRLRTHWTGKYDTVCVRKPNASPASGRRPFSRYTAGYCGHAARVKEKPFPPRSLGLSQECICILHSGFRLYSRAQISISFWTQAGFNSASAAAGFYVCRKLAHELKDTTAATDFSSS